MLFDITRLNRVKPWEIRLAELVKALMEELQRLELIDLQSCGVAAYSAATIHRMKSERLLKADVPSVPRMRPDLFVPPPIDLPLTPEFMTTTMAELINALKAALSRRKPGEADERKPVLEGFDVKIDEFLIKLEERLEEFVGTLREMFEGRAAMSFKELVEGVDRLEAARRFILLLFAAARGIVELEQDEDGSGEIKVRWIGGSAWRA